MKVTWGNVKKVLQGRGASNNEINALRVVFNHDIFQTYLVRYLGAVSESSFSSYHDQKQIAQATGTIDDLGELDSYELVDFIDAHELSYRQAASITPQQISLLGQDQKEKVMNVLIGEGGLDEDPIRYSLSAIVQTGFPYKRVKGQQHFERTNGDLTVTMAAPNEIGLPSGIYPRLAFVHICSEIVKTKSRRINLGPSLKRFVVDEMGRPWSTGKKGTAVKWRESITSLLATSFTITDKVRSQDGKHEGLILKNVSIADEAVLWWDKEFQELQGAEIEVSEKFAEALLSHATPLDIRALKKLADLRGPLAFDLYCWLTYRYWKMEQFNTPIVRIPWQGLYGQLGSVIGTSRQFRYEVRSALEEVKKVYPQANFNSDSESYLILTTSEPHISSKRVGQQKNLFESESS
jgi:hypothetical protein